MMNRIAAILLAVAVIGCGVSPAQEAARQAAQMQAAETTNAVPGVEIGLIGSNVARIVDHDAGVVCYTYGSGSYQGGTAIACLPIEQTRLVER